MSVDFVLVVPVVWLLVVSGFAVVRRPVPGPVFTTGFVVACISNGWLSGWPALLSVGIALLALGLLVWTGAGSWSTLVLVPVLLAGLPVGLYWVLLPGAGLAAVWSMWRLHRVVGPGYVPMVVDETRTAFGMSPTGFVKPDFSRLPLPVASDSVDRDTLVSSGGETGPDSDVDASEGITDGSATVLAAAAGVKVFLPGWLLFGMVVALTAQAVLTR